jgi:hypothetical protein
MAPTLFWSLSTLAIASCVTSSRAGSISHARLHTKKAASLLIANDLPPGWSFSSCYTDSVQARTLTGSVYTSANSMTQESCVGYCTSLSYGYAGVEYSGECYCSNYIASTGLPAAISDCSMGCNGNATESCGGPNRLNLFYNNATAPAPATTAPAAGTSTTTAAGTTISGTSTGWNLIGCFSDGANARTLTYAQGVPNGPNGMTVEQCTSACQAGGFSLAGVEYSTECCESANLSFTRVCLRSIPCFIRFWS